MDFHSMKRKELQVLCKEHKIPANLSKLEMANKLKEIFKEEKITLFEGLIKGQDKIVSETESTNVVVERKVKKVRFSPDHELIEFTRSRDRRRKSRRISVSSKDSSLSVEKVNGGEMNNENVGNLGRVTRSRGLNLMESEVNEKRRGRKGAKNYSQKNNVAAVENFKDGEFVGDDVDEPGPVMQLGGKIVVQGIKNASKRGTKRAKDDDKTDKKALDNADNKKLIEEIVNIPSRLTRSRGKKLLEDSTRKDKRRKVVDNNDNAAMVSAETDDNREVTWKSQRTRGIKREGKLARGLGKTVKNNEKGMVESQILLRRSKRNMNKVGDSEILNDDTRMHENDGKKGLMRTRKLLAVEGSGAEAKSTGSEVDRDGGMALQIEEPIKQGLRRSNRRKTAIMAHENLKIGELKEEAENRYQLRSSTPQLGSPGGTSKGDRKVLQPTGVRMRSRRKTSSLELVSGDGTINTDAAAGNFETENHLSKQCPLEKECPVARKNMRRSTRNASENNSVEISAEFGIDSTIQLKNEARKRKKSPIPGGDIIKTNNDSSFPVQSMRKERGIEKAVPVAATGNVSDIREPSRGLKEPNMLDASSRMHLLEIGGSFVNTEFSVPEGAESINNMGLSSDTNVETIISDMRLTSSRKIHRKKQDISIADSAGNADSRLINRNKIANSDENAASRIAELKTDHTDNKKQISASKLRCEEKIHSSLEFDVKELIEENISEMEKNDTAAQMFSQTKDCSHDNTIDHQVLLGGSIVSGNACSEETCYSADSLLPGYQTYSKSDLQAAEAEVDKQAQPRLEVVDSEVQCASVEEMLQSVEMGCTNAMSSPTICHNNDADHLESSNNISGSNNEDTSSKAGEAGAFQSRDGRIESTDSKSALQLKEPSSGKLRRSIAGDNTAEGDEIYSHKVIDLEVAENDEGSGGCLGNHETGGNENREFYVPDLHGERTARIISQDRGQAILNSDESNYEDTSPKVGALKSCDGHMEYTDLRSALQLEDPSSGKLTRSLAGDSTAEGDEIYSHKCLDIEVAENDDGQCLRDHETASDKGGEFLLLELFGERSARIIQQDKGHAVMNTDENRMYNDLLAVCPIAISANTSKINLTRSYEAHHMAKTDEAYNQSVYSDFVETDEGGSSRHHKSKWDEDAEYGFSNLFAAESSARIMPQDKAMCAHEKSIKDFDSRVMFQDSLSEAPTAMYNRAEIMLKRDHEADQIAGGSTYVHKDEADEGGCFKDHQTSTKDKDPLFGFSNLFDAERSAPSTPEGTSSLHEISPSKPNSASESKGVMSTIYNTCEIIGKEAGAADTIHGRDVAIFRSKIPEDEVSMDRTISDGEHEPFNQSDEDTNKDTYEPSEQTKSPVADSVQGQEAGSSGNKTAIHSMAVFKANGKGKSSQVAQGSNTDGNANDASGKDKEEIVDASITDVPASLDYTIRKIGVESLNELKFQDIKETEHECKSPLVRQTMSHIGEESGDISSQSWTEFELNTLFGTTVDSVTPARLNDTSCQGTEMANLTISVNNSVTSSVSSLTNMKKEMVVERGSEYAKTTNKNFLLQPKHEEASDIIFSLGSEENQLKLLFATPIKIVTPCEVDEASASKEKLANAAMFKESVCTTKENVVTQIKSDEQVGDIAKEFEYSLSVGNSLPHDGEDVTSEELNQAEVVELVNKCTTQVLSGGKYDGCEASKELFTENTCEGVRKTDFVTEENEEEKIISLGQSCLYEEATGDHSEGSEKDNTRSSGALRNLDKVEGCNDLLIDTDLSESLSCEGRSYLQSEGELVQSSEVVVELPDAGFQKSSIPENGHCGYVDSNILRETSIDNSRDPMDAEVATVGSFDGGKYVIDKGTSPSLLNASYIDGVAERKDADSIRADDDPYHDISDTLDETYNLSSSHDISDGLHTNREAAILKNFSVGFTPSQEAHKLQNILELQYKETNLTGITTQNAHNVVPAAEHGASVCGAESDILSSMAMHLLLGDNENGDINKSEARTPRFNLEDDGGKSGKEVEEHSTEARVQFSISKLNLDEKIVDRNNDIHTVSDASTSRCNEILKESDVADTIQEYIDSESSLSMDFEVSGAILPLDALAHIDEKSTCENAVMCESEEAINDKPSVETLETEGNLEESTLYVKPAPMSEEAVKSSLARIDLLVESSTANEPSVESLETEKKELEESTLFMKTAPGSEEAVKCSPAHVDLPVKRSTDNKLSVDKKGAAITEKFLISKEIDTSSKQLNSTRKKNARTILIHGTPRKLLTMADMKENPPVHKSSNIGDFTAARPAKRKALRDVQWK